MRMSARPSNKYMSWTWGAIFLIWEVFEWISWSKLEDKGLHAEHSRAETYEARCEQVSEISVTTQLTTKYIDVRFKSKSQTKSISPLAGCKGWCMWWTNTDQRRVVQSVVIQKGPSRRTYEHDFLRLNEMYLVPGGRGSRLHCYKNSWVEGMIDGLRKCSVEGWLIYSNGTQFICFLLRWQIL